MGSQFHGMGDGATIFDGCPLHRCFIEHDFRAIFHLNCTTDVNINPIDFALNHVKFMTQLAGVEMIGPLIDIVGWVNRKEDKASAGGRIHIFLSF